MNITNENTVQLTDDETAIKARFEKLLTNGWSVIEALASVKHLHPNVDPVFCDWIAGRSTPSTIQTTKFYHDNSDVFIVIVNNGDTEPELWGFHDGDLAREFAAFRGGDVEDITVLGNVAARELIEGERKR